MTRAMYAAVVAALVITGALTFGSVQEAAAQSGKGEVLLIAPGSIRTALEEQLIPKFERKTGYKVKASWGSDGFTHQEVVRGEACDVAVGHPPFQDMIDSGNVVASSEKVLASVALGVAVHEGAPKPDISSPEAAKKMYLAAKSIAIASASNGSSAGVSADEALKNLGITDQVESKIKRAQGGSGALFMVAKGEAEVGMTYMSEMQLPGIEVVGPLPPGISTPVKLVGFVATHAQNPAAAKALLEYLASPEAMAEYKAQHMVPAK